jgi:hypothetical protein
MIRNRFDRWNCSKIADIIRGSKKPFALGWREWDVWHEDAKKKHPLRYYLAETGLKTLQNILYFPYDIYNTIDIYVRNRWIDKTHMIKTGLKPGQYYEFDTKVLHGLFNELVDYVEVELAHTMKAYKDRDYKFKNGRCKQAGLDHLDWACALRMGTDFNLDLDDPDYDKPTRQAISSQKIKDLYLWWTEIRPLRLDPLDLYDTIEHSKRETLDKIDEISQMYDDEDTNMLTHLISIRHDIWC